MTNIALSQLQQQIEAVRREAFADGYAAAMQLVRDFAARPPALSPGSRQTLPALPVARLDTGAATRGRRRGMRLPHGTNARLVAAVLESIAPRTARPSEIRRLLWREHGVTLAFTSIRHALGQLTERQAAEPVGNSKAWRHLPAAVASAAADD